jgi:hypothetical protein
MRVLRGNGCTPVTRLLINTHMSHRGLCKEFDTELLYISAVECVLQEQPYSSGRLEIRNNLIFSSNRCYMSDLRFSQRWF